MKHQRRKLWRNGTSHTNICYLTDISIKYKCRTTLGNVELLSDENINNIINIEGINKKNFILPVSLDGLKDRGFGKIKNDWM